MHSSSWTNQASFLRNNNNLLSLKPSNSTYKLSERNSNSILSHSFNNSLLLLRAHSINRPSRSNSHRSNSSSLNSLVSLSLSTNSNSLRRKTIASLKAMHLGLFLNRPLNKSIKTCSEVLTCLKPRHSQTRNSKTAKINLDNSNLHRSKIQRVVLKDCLTLTRWSKSSLTLLRKIKRRRRSNKTNKTSCMFALMKLSTPCSRVWVDLTRIMFSVRDKEIKDFSSVQQVS